MNLDQVVDTIVDNLASICSKDIRDDIKDLVYESIIELWHSLCNFIEYCIAIDNLHIKNLCLFYHIIFVKFPEDLYLKHLYTIIEYDWNTPYDKYIEFLLRYTILIEGVQRSIVRLYLAPTLLKTLTKLYGSIECRDIRYRIHEKDLVDELE